MGNVRFVLRTILGVVLFFSLTSGLAQARSGGTCQSLFTSYEANVNPVPTGAGLRANPKLKIATWNVFNLKIPEIEYPVGSEAYRNTPQNERMRFAKSAPMLAEMKRVFDDINADIYVLQEVFSKESLEYIVKKYLNDKYIVVLEKGNDTRGINVGFLIKKSLNVSYELKSHKDLHFKNDYGVYPAGTPIFSRDLPALYLRQKDGSNSRASDEPDLVVLGAHFKSKRPTDGDFESTNRREVEFKTTAEVLKNLDQQFGGRVPWVLALDANTRIDSSAESSALRNSYEDSLSLMGNKISAEDRVTHTFHPLIDSKDQPGKKFEGRVQAHQVDAQYVNEAMGRRLLNSYVYRFKDIEGKTKLYRDQKGNLVEYPTRFKERKKNASDHMPIVAEYDMTRK